MRRCALSGNSRALESKQIAYLTVFEMPAMPFEAFFEARHGFITVDAIAITRLNMIVPSLRCLVLALMVRARFF
jgi:hypothetical protein